MWVNLAKFINDWLKLGFDDLTDFVKVILVIPYKNNCFHSDNYLK